MVFPVASFRLIAERTGIASCRLEYRNHSGDDQTDQDQCGVAALVDVLQLAGVVAKAGPPAELATS